MWWFVFIFLGGLWSLISGADFLIRGSSSLARRFGLSAFFISLTVVSFGTSAPELTISFLSNIEGNSDLALSNTIGSNIANVLLVLGLASILRPLSIKRSTVRKEIPFSVFGVFMLIILVNDKWWGQGGANWLSRADGLVLLALFVVFIYYSFGTKRVGNDKDGVISMVSDKIKSLDAAMHSPAKSISMSLGGAFLLFLGGEMIVRSVVGISGYFGIGQTVLGLTAVAIGTSLPELTASALAAKRGQTDIAVGNVVGSNVVNLFFILGVCAVSRPMTYEKIFNQDLFFLLFANFVFLALSYFGGYYIVKRWEGAIMILSYVVYLFFTLSSRI